MAREVPCEVSDHFMCSCITYLVAQVLPYCQIATTQKLCDAAFVTSSAVGMACGPLLALPLSYLPTTSLGPISIDPVTAGGWVMGLLWLTFLLLTLLIFEEPKSG